MLNYVIGFGFVGHIFSLLMLILAITVLGIIMFNSKKDDVFSWFVLFSRLIVAVGVLLTMSVGVQALLYGTPAVKVVTKIDAVIINFLAIIKFQYIVWWFVIPVALMFMYYILLSFKVYLGERKEWVEWNKNHPDGSSIKLEKPKLFKDNKRSKMPKKKPEIEVNEQNITDVPYQQPLRLLKCSTLSKKGQIQLGKTDDGYVMVVNNPEHDALFRYTVEKVHGVVKDVPEMPYVAFFNNNDLKMYTVKEYGRNLLNKG